MRYVLVQAQLPVPITMNKNFLKMLVMSGVVVVCFSSCDHFALELSHYANNLACHSVVHPQPVVVHHHEPAPQHVVVHHQPASRPQHVVHHKPAPNPKPVAQHKPAMNQRPVAQHIPAAKPKPVAQNKAGKSEKRPAARRA